MNRALFFLISIVATFATDASPDLADADVRVANLAVEGLKSCPPCTHNCAHDFKCHCGSCVPITPGSIAVDCNRGYSYDYLLRRCVAVSCEALTACPTSQTCIPELRLCARAPCPQFKCVQRDECPSCHLVKCTANHICKCGKCQPINCPSCLKRCPLHTQCKCGKCLPIIERECGDGEAYDSRIDRCVPVSCSASYACPSSQICVPKRVDCVHAPCPQFECQARPSCAHGELYDYHLKRCVAVSCSAPHACDWNEVCVPKSLHCPHAPCPQFYCRNRFHYYTADGIDAAKAHD